MSGMIVVHNPQPGTLTNLKAQAPGFAPSVYLEGRERAGDGGEGMFVWERGDHRTHVASDPHAGVYVTPNSDPTGASGCWVRAEASRGEVRPQWFASIDWTRDDATTAIQAAITAAAATKPAKLVYFPAGTYVLTKQVDFSPLDGIVLGGLVAFDFTGATDSAQFTLGGFVNIIGNDLVVLPRLAADVAEGDDTLTFVSNPRLSKGDIVVIYNPTDSSYSGFRKYYRAGEHAIVSDGSGSTTVRRFGGAAAHYAAASVNVYKHAAKQFTVSGGRLRILESTAAALSNVAGVHAKWLAYIDLSAFEPTNSGYAGIYLDQCVGVFGANYHVRQDRFDARGSATYYGIAIGNSSYIDISGYFFGGRHAVATGGRSAVGAVPCRYGRVTGHFENSYQAGARITAANMHGNTEHWHYEGTFQGGVTLAGNHNSATGEMIARDSQHGVAVVFTELSGCDHKISGRITAFGNPGEINHAVVDCGANSTTDLTADTVKGGTLDFSGLKINAPNASRLISIRNRGYVGTEPIIVDVRGASWLRTDAPSPIALVVDHVGGNTIDRLLMEGFDNGPNAAHSIVVSKIEGWRDSGSVRLAPSTSSSTVSTEVTFNKKAPKAPVVIASLESNTVGGSIALAYSTSPSTTGFTANARTISGSNFAGTTAGTINWIAMIDE